MRTFSKVWPTGVIFIFSFILVLSYQNCAPQFAPDSFEGSSQATSNSQLNNQDLNPPIISIPSDVQRILFSDTKDGFAGSIFIKQNTIYGVASGFSQTQTWSCAEPMTSTGCLNPNSSSWIKMPNADWTYDTLTRSWIMARNFSTIASGSYRIGFMDKSPDAINRNPAYAQIELVDTVNLTISRTLNGTHVNSFKNTETMYFKLSGFGSNEVYGCAEPSGSGACTASKFLKYPVNGWYFNSADNTWRLAWAFGDVPPGQYSLHFEDRERNLKLTHNVTLYRGTGTCSWDHGFVIGPCEIDSAALGLGSCTNSNNGQVKNHANTCGSVQSTCRCQ
ncbi:MAG: hypothetical protein ACLGGX_09230 [Bdellovibrionia bacterium]